MSADAAGSDSAVLAALYRKVSLRLLPFLFCWAWAKWVFFPGIIYYLTLWYPSARRAQATAWFMAGAGSLFASLAALSLAAFGVLSALTVFWPLPAATLTGRAAAGDIALINAIGNLGGYASPAALGWLKDATGRMDAGLLFLALALTVAAPLGWVLSAARR